MVEVKFTAAVPLSSLVTWMELPATDAIRPLTFASAFGAAEVLVEVTVEVEVDVEVGLDLFDVPQADRDTAVASCHGEHGRARDSWQTSRFLQSPV
ncbi:hypothetical protein MLM_1766 [Mycobacterium lepraemurium]|nr:hypothetical protein MLM_1766 [Mycobacterium lepraemurium]